MNIVFRTNKLKKCIRRNGVFRKINSSAKRAIVARSNKNLKIDVDFAYKLVLKM